jgi:hypothetical protein
MSGIEVAGIVLGVIPLIISAFEDYREGLESMKGWWMYRPQFLDFIHKVGVQSTLFKSNIEELLTPVVESEAQLVELLRVPGGPAWKGPELEERLKERLRKSYDWYLVVIEDMRRDMEKLKKNLGIKDGKVCFNFFYNIAVILQVWRIILERTAL